MLMWIRYPLAKITFVKGGWREAQSQRRMPSAAVCRPRADRTSFTLPRRRNRTISCVQRFYVLESEMGITTSSGDVVEVRWASESQKVSGSGQAEEGATRGLVLPVRIYKPCKLAETAVR
jgi:hypothetical protein